MLRRVFQVGRGFRILGVSILLLVICTSVTIAQTKPNVPLPEPPPVSMGYFSDLDRALLFPDKVIELNLRDKGLTNVPVEITKFQNLEILDLANNELTSIPDFISELPNLRSLFLNENRLASVDESITKCTNLRVLNVGENPIKTVSASIGSMVNLEKLIISSTAANVQFQDAIWDVPNLMILRLIGMNIDHVPSKISNMHRLEELCLQDNNIAEFPQELITLPSLSYISLGNNHLHEVPAKLGSMKQLYYLALFGNPITTVPEELEGLKGLEFFACWDTQINETERERIERLLPNRTKTNFDGEGIH